MTEDERHSACIGAVTRFALRFEGPGYCVLGPLTYIDLAWLTIIVAQLVLAGMLAMEALQIASNSDRLPALGEGRSRSIAGRDGRIDLSCAFAQIGQRSRRRRHRAEPTPRGKGAGAK